MTPGSPPSPRASDGDHGPRGRPATDAFEVFHRALDLAPEERASYLASACPDPDLRARVERLLRSDERAPRGFLPSAEADAQAGGARIGRFVLLERLGEGGMGTVWAASQEFPRREVALKRIRSGRLSETARQRFEKEVQALGSLQHPGIAQIYEAGSAPLEGPGSAGRAREEPYLVMELVRGKPLLEHAEARGLDAAQRLELVARVADAVHHAHQRGVIHRDLKPDNVLVAEEETGSDHPPAARGPIGQPKILDFGIARIVGEEGSGLTRAGELVGTLSSMSPEQVEGRGGIDERSDVWSLGAMAYQLLSGRLPHDLSGLSVPEAARVLQSERPAPLEEHDPRLRGDVSTIVARALDRDPSRRYASAAAFAEDVRRHLRGAPIRARSDSTLYLLRRRLRRHRLAFAGGLLVVVCALAVGREWLARRALADETDLRLRGALSTLAELERMSTDYLQHSPAQRELLRSTLAQRLRLLEGVEVSPADRVVLARNRALLGVLERTLGEPRGLDRLLAAIDELRSLRGLAPEAEEQLVYSYKELAHIHEGEGDLAAAEAALAEGLAVEGVTPAWRAALFAHLARLQRGRGDEPGATALYEEALAELGPRDPANPPSTSLADVTRWECLGMLGSLQAERGALDEAAATFEALEPMLTLLERPTSPVFRAQAAHHLNNMANLAFLRGERERVWPLIERAQELVEELVRHAPGHLDFERDLVTTLLNHGAFLASEGRFDEARGHLARGEELAAELARSHSATPLFAGIRGVLLLNLAKLDLEQRAPLDALSRLEAATPLLERGIRELPGHLEWRSGLAEARVVRTSCLAAAGRHEEARRALEGLAAEGPAGWRALEGFSEALAAAGADERLTEEDRAVVSEAYVEAAILHALRLAESGAPTASLRDPERFPALGANPSWNAFLELLEE